MAGDPISASVPQVTSLLLGGLSHLQCRELAEADVGYKISRVHVYPWQLNVALHWVRERRLSWQLSRFGIDEGIAREGTGSWYNTGRRSADAKHRLRYLYVGRQTREVVEAQAIDHVGRDHVRLGELLRIPQCCIMFYLAHRRVAQSLHRDEYVKFTSLASPPIGSYRWEMNYLGQYFGFSLYHHYPCSWVCSATLSRAQYALCILQKVSRDWAAAFRRHLRGAVICEPGRAVHCVRGEVTADTARFTSTQVVSTDWSPLGGALRTSGSIRAALATRRRGRSPLLLFFK